MFAIFGQITASGVTVESTGGRTRILSESLDVQAQARSSVCWWTHRIYCPTEVVALAEVAAGVYIMGCEGWADSSDQRNWTTNGVVANVVG